MVLVHGNPETSAIWEPCGRTSSDEGVALSPPGFGVPVPEGFGATSDEYLAWLSASSSDRRPWTSSATTGVAATCIASRWSRPELIRSWVSDVAGIFDPDYVWHDIAQAWQTPGAGEEAVADDRHAAPPERAKAVRTRASA